MARACSSLNARQELFVQGLLAGKTAERAYSDAGYKSHRANAARMSANDNIASRLAELRKPVVKAVQVTLEGHLRDLKALRDTAEEAGQFGAAISAEVHRGKASGLYVERRSSRNDTAVAIQSEALSVLDGWLAEQLGGEGGAGE